MPLTFTTAAWIELKNLWLHPVDINTISQNHSGCNVYSSAFIRAGNGQDDVDDDVYDADEDYFVLLMPLSAGCFVKPLHTHP